MLDLLEDFFMKHIVTIEKPCIKLLRIPLRRVPGFLPVCLQDVLHRGQPEVPEAG